MSENTELAEAIAAAVEEATAGLKAKNTELLGKLKKAQAGAEIKPEELAAVEAERDEWKAKAQDATKAAAKATKEAEAHKATAEAVSAREQRLLIDNGLNEALAKAGVSNPILAKAAKAILAAQTQVVADGDARVVKVGDKGLGEFITEWAGSEEGKHFIAAPDTQGGGSQGGSRGSNTPNGDMGGDKAARLARSEAILRENGAAP